MSGSATVSPSSVAEKVTPKSTGKKKPRKSKASPEKEEDQEGTEEDDTKEDGQGEGCTSGRVFIIRCTPHYAISHQLMTPTDTPTPFNESRLISFVLQLMKIYGSKRPVP